MAPSGAAVASDQPQPVTSVQAAVPVLDLGVLASLVGDDPKVLAGILADYCKSAGRLAAELRAAAAESNTSGISATAHKLKSSSCSIGALHLGEICAGLERFGKAQTLDAIPACMAQFEVAMAEVQSCIAECLEREGNP
jgi:two-component system, sensor histidine kinase and response regulator